MKSFIAILVIVVAASAVPTRTKPNILVEYNAYGMMKCRRDCGRAANTCPIVKCPTPPIDSQCPAPDCDVPLNRNFIFPTTDPTTFFQCSPVVYEDGLSGWTSTERVCGCQTYFDYSKQACVHPADWKNQCSETPEPTPPTRQCVVKCEDC